MVTQHVSRFQQLALWSERHNWANWAGGGHTLERTSCLEEETPVCALMWRDSTLASGQTDAVHWKVMFETMTRES